MINEELLSYIARQLKKGTSRDAIVSNLVGAGWKLEDVKEGFSNTDIYHEPLYDNSFDEINLTQDNKKESFVVEEKKEPIEDKKKEIVQEIKIENDKPEMSVVLDTEELPAPLNEVPLKKEEPQSIPNSFVWIPKSVPIKEAKKEEIKQENKNNEIVEKKEPISETIINSFTHQNKTEKDNLVPQNNPSIKISEVKDVSKIAMLSSYKTDSEFLLNKDDDKRSMGQNPKKKKHVGLLLFLFLLIILGALFFLYKEGIINLKFKKENSSNIIDANSLSSVLLEKTNNLSSLKSYKTETSIDISSIAVFDILSGNVKDENPTTQSLNLNILSLVNDSGLVSDNFITIKGTIIPDYITTDLKINGQDSYVSFPDLKQFKDKFSPQSGVVKINKEEFGLLPSLFSLESGERLNKVNLYKIFSNSLPSHVNNDVINLYNNFLSNENITDRGDDIVKGITSRRYSVSTDSQFAKDLLFFISKNFASENLSLDDQNKLNDILNSSSISSLDVWVGKDSDIYQYDIKIDFPLSKVLNIKDLEGTLKDKISISWRSTFYDFNVSNNIFIPSEFKIINEFNKDAKIAKIKNELVAFQEESKKVFEKNGSYGLKSNTLGSCANPTEGSIFSDVGHNETVLFNINLISNILKNVLNDTGGKSYCYSNSKAWSLAVPILNDYSQTNSVSSSSSPSYFCVDSTGVKDQFSYLTKGVSCPVKKDIKKIESTDVTTKTP